MNSKPKYCIEMWYEDDDFPHLNHWSKVGLTMCYGGENCGCYSRGQSAVDNCDNILYETEDIELAKERLDAEKQAGNTVRLKRLEVVQDVKN